MKRTWKTLLLVAVIWVGALVGFRLLLEAVIERQKTTLLMGIAKEADFERACEALKAMGAVGPFPEDAQDLKFESGELPAGEARYYRYGAIAMIRIVKSASGKVERIDVEKIEER